MLPTNPLLNATAPAGPHLPMATLRQYAAGTLSPAAQHRVEAHTLACSRCADALAGFLQTTPATTDQALAQLQQRLRRRVQLAPQALPATRTRHRHRLMALQLAAAATLLFGLVAGGWWTWQQRHAAPTTAARPVATPRALTVPAASTAPGHAVTGTVASAVVIQEVDSPRKRAIELTSHAYARRRLRVRARDYVIATTTCKCGPDTPDLSDYSGHYEADLAELAQAIGKQSAAPQSVNHLAALAVTATTLPAASPLIAKGLVAANRAIQHDSVAASLQGRVAGVAVNSATEPAALVRADAMPAAPAIPPAPVGGYGAWREKLRREATEFKPELPEQPLSGTVQLRLLIGADGKIQEMRVLHGLRADYDAEAQRLVCESANWVPGIGGGKRAAQPVDVAVPFQ